MNTRSSPRFIFTVLAFSAVFGSLSATAQSVSNAIENATITGPFPVTLHGDSTNQLPCYKVDRGDPRPFGNNRIVIIDPASRQALATVATNNVYYFRNRLFRISPGILSLRLAVARPISNGTLSPKVIMDLVTQSEPRYPLKEGAYERKIDVSSILRAETDKPYAQPLFLRSVRVENEEGHIAVYFVSNTGIPGKVVLDDDLNPISMVIAGSPLRRK